MTVSHFSVFEQESIGLACNTEKDKSISHIHRTMGTFHLTMNMYKCQCAYTCMFDWNTGILAGIWPCGIVTFLSELFLSESKSQVYGSLHNFFRQAPDTAAGISKYTIKIDYYNYITPCAI